MLTPSTVRQLLQPFGLDLDTTQEGCLLTYLELLMRWNRKINLIGPTSEDECVTRHFGESLFLANWVNLQGRLLDIGSGAGFPGLALKIVCPNLSVTLLEPVGKKRAFLKEVARACQLDSVEVRGDRLEEFARLSPLLLADVATARAVGNLGKLAEHAGHCLMRGGLLCLWLGKDQSARLRESKSQYDWQAPIPIPLSRAREMLIGQRT